LKNFAKNKKITKKNKNKNQKSKDFLMKPLLFSLLLLLLFSIAHAEDPTPEHTDAIPEPAHEITSEVSDENIDEEIPNNNEENREAELAEKYREAELAEAKREAELAEAFEKTPVNDNSGPSDEFIMEWEKVMGNFVPEDITTFKIEGKSSEVFSFFVKF